MAPITRDTLPRLPLEGHIDLTYRCNNNCRHCWLSIPAVDPARERELSFDEIKNIVDQARAMGTRRWSISGGEPMLRPDFPEIFEYLTRKAVSYTLNTNGTRITPEIGHVLKRKGTKMVALYGATKETYDHVTSHPGGFEKVMQGFHYLKEAGAGFIVQLIPMRDNWHEWGRMTELAQSLSRHWRVGAPWLYLSSCHDPVRNAEISRQRLDPREVVELDKPDLSYEDATAHEYEHAEGDDRLLARCIAGRRDFHVDPYGGMTFCCFIKDPALRYDLRKGTFRAAWDEFIPGLADKVHGGAEYEGHCGSCGKRKDCRWCPVYGWLEHGRFSAPVEHLCDVAGTNKRFKEEWQARHRRYFRIAGMTIQVDSDLPIDDQTFHPKFAAFRADGPGADTVVIRHHFTLPDLTANDLGRELYRKPPWAIYQQNGSYIYLGISSQADDPSLHCVATFNADHTRARIYNDDVREGTWRKGGLHSLTMFSSDQILIARLLADRNGCYLHSAGAVINGAGMLFVGHSDAGKSTITRLLIQHCHSFALCHPERSEGSSCFAQDRSEHSEESPASNDETLRTAQGDRGAVEILCDDRNIVRRMDDGWRVYGTWSHGDVPLVSANDAPLRAICFIEKANENTLTPLTDRKKITRRLLACVIKPFVTADWWTKTLDLIAQMVGEVPCYVREIESSAS
ncbi:MAG: radical SAM protein [candidate division WOR-3 bacterium]|nr:radical SAM protein [candidate division WOR-3 bacterium]